MYTEQSQNASNVLQNGKNKLFFAFWQLYRSLSLAYIILVSNTVCDYFSR